MTESLPRIIPPSVVAGFFLIEIFGIINLMTLNQWLKFFLLLIIFFNLPREIASQERVALITPPEKKKVVYELPYPGILADHPLYFLKRIRDKVAEIMIVDESQKAKFHLHQADKKVTMAIFLAKKGNPKASVDAFHEAEKEVERFILIFKKTKEKKRSIPSGLLDQAKLANAKHREIIGEMIKFFPDGYQQTINQLFETNFRLEKELARLP
ncbi:MAG: DUF5667 domain-containing protein [Patescibacteria group bacterium]|nr:DUF5667 domain-containing protein [Patescibacteria group bacterium]